MKTKLTLSSLVVIFIMATSIIFSSCKKDSSTTPVVKTVLADSITAAENLLAGATEGTAPGNYVAGSKAILQTTIDAVKVIHDNPASTQANIDAAVVNLHNAMQTFRAAVIVPIAEANLIAYWAFDEGTGTTVTDVSKNALNGTLKVGYSTIVGVGQLPAWTTDRYGVANKALQFDKGGHIEVPYNTALFPTEISISLWAKVDHKWPNNYVISQNWWEGYKLQYQEANKVFFTYKNAVPNYYDRDWSVNGQDTVAWHHVVVTLKEGEEDFYADGQLVKSWTDVTGGLNPPPNPVTFTIGQQFPNEVPSTEDPGKGGAGYFRGSLDDIAIYNVALSATQVQGIFDMQKP